MEFKEFKVAVQEQFKRMQGANLFRVNLDKDVLWKTYLESFPEGTNPIFRERTEHDCQCCKSFIRAVGNVVTITNNKIESIWNINIGGHYQIVADAMAKYVESFPIDNVFLHAEKTAGTDKNYQQLENGEVLGWEHFFIDVPSKNYCKGIDIGTKLSEYRSTFDVMYRGLEEITVDSIETVLELIAQNSLYRGEEHLHSVKSFQALKNEFDKSDSKILFCWNKVWITPTVARIRNTSIGTLLVDISEGIDLEKAVKAFESKVAPHNYKRTSAVVSKSMVESAKKKLEELGLVEALERRHAVIEDISINNVLFADRAAKKRMDVFDEIAAKTTKIPKKLERVESVDIETFVKEILPRAESIELMFENKHTSNLVSLIAPAMQGKSMFKWDNNFSWSYNGEVADSIKERVKKAGGNVGGYLRFSLSWFNFDDLDLHMVEPNGYEIFYGNRGFNSPCRGTLDVDMNAGSGTTRTPVENICYSDRKYLKDGTYRLFVQQFSQRESKDVGFEVEFEVEGRMETLTYDKPVKGNVPVLEIKYSKTDGIKIIKSLPSSQSTKEVWGINTQQFHKVNAVMFSPNYWDEKATGNKHYFFMLDECKNMDSARGFYNEFLSSELDAHRKVFEILGSKMKVENSENQLSGLGFSSTQRNEVLCRVTGSFSRTIKITF